MLSPLCDSREKSVDAAQKFLLSFCLEANIVLCSGQNIGGSISSGKHISSRSKQSCAFVSVKLSPDFFWDKISSADDKAGLSANMLDITSSGQNIRPSSLHFFCPQSDPKTPQEAPQPQKGREVTFQLVIRAVTWSRWWHCGSRTGLDK